ncbi:MAG TPA: peptidyl-prolyl cis-trans isomerase [Solirubrobacteraceae bacterium]|nr:peptidyl-prolyl cis-trans isomerase [Solirubrobacteraceae bacterium]
MSKTIRFVTALGAVFFAVFALAACGGGIPGDSVVKVGGTAIKKTTFDHWLRVALVSNVSGTKKVVVPEPPEYKACIAQQAETEKSTKGAKPKTTAQLKKQCAETYKSLQQEVLGFLISSQWVLGEADSLGIHVSDAEVKKQFNKIKTQQFPKASDFEKFLKTSGQTVSDLLLRVKLNVLSGKIQTKVTKGKSTVTEAQVAKYYNENKSRYGTPEKRAVDIILTKTEATANGAKQEVESGKSFASVAKAKSIDPTSKAKGGLLPEVIKGEEQKALDAAIFSASANKLSGPVKTPFGFYVFEVKKISAGSQQTLAQSKAAIKAQLSSTSSQKALSEFVKNFKKKWTAKTDCRSEFVVTDCKQYKAPKTTKTTGTTTTTE